MSKIDAAALDQLFLKARTQNKWQAKPVPVELLHELADILKMGPTSANCSPARIVFVTTDAARARLKPHLSPGNVDKTMAAPVTAIIGYDTEFYEKLPQLFPHADARAWFVGKPAFIEATAFRNSSLQGAYLMLAARSLGLDVGGMSGFDPAGVEKEFFPGGKIKANFLCNLGYGDPSGVMGRSPRFKFEEFCEVV